MPDSSCRPLRDNAFLGGNLEGCVLTLSVSYNRIETVPVEKSTFCLRYTNEIDWNVFQYSLSVAKRAGQRVSPFQSGRQ